MVEHVHGVARFHFSGVPQIPLVAVQQRGWRNRPARGDGLNGVGVNTGAPKVVLARLNPDLRTLAPAAVARAKALIGRPYDDQFLLDNGKFYCSELVYETYLDADGRHLFAVAPMTFCPPNSSVPHPAWRDYFQRKGQPIPEGRLGCNPGGLSRSNRLDIIFAFGRPSGWSSETYRRFSQRVPAPAPSPRPLPGPAFSGQ